MFRSWRVGEAFGIGVYLHPTTLLLPLFYFWQLSDTPAVAAVAAAGVVVTFVCVLLHEYGHALMARRFGIGTQDITLYPVGGVARLNRMSEDPVQELWIALAGPAVNVAIGIGLALFMGAAGVPVVGLDLSTMETVSAVDALLNFALFANVALVFFNLLPAFPMDGGRVLRALLAMAFDRVRATQIAAGVGAVMAALFVVGGFLTGNLMLSLIGVLAYFLGQAELAAVRQQAYARQMEQAGWAAWDEEPVGRQADYVVPRTAVPRDPLFSGFTLDREAGLWIEWRGGRPVAATPYYNYN